jgi:hypothetical protein
LAAPIGQRIDGEDFDWDRSSHWRAVATTEGVVAVTFEVGGATFEFDAVIGGSGVNGRRRSRLLIRCATRSFVVSESGPRPTPYMLFR